MKRNGHVAVNPFHGASLPRKQYKKAVKTDQGKTIPVMNEREYREIIKEIESATRRRGKHHSHANARNGARRLLPAVRVMAEHGLRVGAVPTVEVKGDYFTYTTKGGRSETQAVKPGIMPAGKHPFRGYRLITIQKAFKRLTGRLCRRGAIRHAYTCHDLRHHFAVREYRLHGDLVRLKKLLGHASLNVTDIYLQSIGAIH